MRTLLSGGKWRTRGYRLRWPHYTRIKKKGGDCDRWEKTCQDWSAQTLKVGRPQNNCLVKCGRCCINDVLPYTNRCAEWFKFERFRNRGFPNASYQLAREELVVLGRRGKLWNRRREKHLKGRARLRYRCRCRRYCLFGIKVATLPISPTTRTIFLQKGIK